MGMAGVAGADVRCVALGVAARAVAVGVAVGDAGAEACADLVVCGEAGACVGVAVCGELGGCVGLVVRGALVAGGALAAAELVAEACGEVMDGRGAWPFGDGVRVPECGCDVGGVCGGKTVGDGVGPPVHAETATRIRAAPAAERPAVSHAPWVSAGGVSRSFMNPPRMRVR